DRDLRRAQHMTGRMKGDGDVVQRHRLAEDGRLRGPGKILAVAQSHNVERLLCGQHRAVAGAGMIGMAVRDQRPVDRPHRVDEEIAGWAIEAFWSGMEQIAGAHAVKIAADSSAASLMQETADSSYSQPPAASAGGPI